MTLDKILRKTPEGFRVTRIEQYVRLDRTVLPEIEVPIITNVYVEMEQNGTKNRTCALEETAQESFEKCSEHARKGAFFNA